MVEKRLDEETTETTLELLSTFLDNLSAPQDALTITKINNQIHLLKQRQQQILTGLHQDGRELERKLEVVRQGIQGMKEGIMEEESKTFPIVELQTKIADQSTQIAELNASISQLQAEYNTLLQESNQKPPLSKEVVSLSLFQQLGIEFFDQSSTNNNGGCMFKRGMTSNLYL